MPEASAPGRWNGLIFRGTTPGMAYLEHEDGGRHRLWPSTRVGRAPDADLVLEGVYTTGHQEQLYIETHGVIAMPPTGDLLAHVLGSMQCLSLIHI